VVMIAPHLWIARRNGASFSNAKCNSNKDALKNAKGFKYDRSEMKWIPEDAPATTGAPAPRSNSR
jgi:hypothetical protein